MADAQSHSSEEWVEDHSDDGSDLADEPTPSLFDGSLHPSAEKAVAYDAQQHGFDLLAFKREHHLDDYETIKLINFMRTATAAGQDPQQALAAAASSDGGAARPWAGERYLQPVMEDDPLIPFVLGLEDGEEGGSVEGAGAAGGSGAVAALRSEVAALRSENAALRSLAAVMADSLPPEVRELMGQQAAAAAHSDGADTSGNGAGPSSAAAANTPQAAAGVLIARGQRLRPQAAEVDAIYFNSYSHFGIHREMLSDQPRTRSYLDALQLNPGLLRGARVLDVGCGTGILAMAAARSGAARVIGLDGSKRIAAIAEQVVAANGLSAVDGGTVSIVGATVEELIDIGVEAVDVLVSEWMGYALLFESMLDSVLHARDRWLRPGGAMLPDRATIHVAGATASALDLEFWQDVYGFTMAPIAAELAATTAGRAAVQHVLRAAICTTPAQVLALDLATCNASDQDFTANFTLRAVEGSSCDEKDGARDASIAALVLWFDVAFSERYCAEHPVVLSTSPFAPLTHWVQTVLPLPAPISLAGASGGATGVVVVEGQLSMARSRHKHRQLDISVEARGLDMAGLVVGEPQVALFCLDVTLPA